MTASVSITDIVSRLPKLRETLDDLNVQHVVIAASGAWSFEKLGRLRAGGSTFAKQAVRDIAALVEHGRPLRYEEWAIRRIDGVAGPSLLIERLPVAVADRLPQEVLAVLKKQVRTSGNGALIGPPGSGKAALMLWLALQIPDETVVYVSENPPAEFPGSHILHVFPPSTPGERRALERLVRLSATVLWDRVASTDDLSSLFGFPGAKRRWFSLDASSVRSAMRRLSGAVQYGCDARFTTMLSLSTSVIGRPEPRNLAVRTENGWTEPYQANDSCLEHIFAFEERDLGRLRTTEVSVPGFLPMAASIHVADDFAAEAAEREQPVVTEAHEPDEADEPPPSPSEPSPLTLEIDDIDIHDDAVTGMLLKDEINELREQQMALEGEAAETQLQPSLKVRLANRGITGVPEVTKAYTETPDEIALDAHTTVGSIDGPFPIYDDETLDPEGGFQKINLENMRITADSEVDEQDLFATDPDGEQSESEVDDFSGVFDGDLDFASLAEEMMSEISEVNLAGTEGHAQTSPEHAVMLSEDDLELVEHDPSDATVAQSGDIVELARSMKRAGPGEEDSTREFQLGEKLQELRDRTDD